MSIMCPICEKSDSIQKISTLFAQGVTTTNSGNHTTASKAQLSEKLRKPEEPSKITPFGIAIIAHIIGAIAGSGCITALLGVGVVVGLLNVQVGISSPYIFLVGIVILMVLFRSNYIADAKRQTARHDRWKSQISNWHELYYCQRDDCVFDPRTNEHTLPEEMMKLL